MSVSIGHIDVFGHLNNVAVFRLLEQSRIEYTVDVGLVQWNELGLILARVDCSFRAQGFYGDNLVSGCKAEVLYAAPRGLAGRRDADRRCRYSYRCARTGQADPSRSLCRVAPEAVRLGRRGVVEWQLNDRFR